MSEPLRPCPFCGGKPELISGAPGCHFVMCSECTVSSDVMSKERTVAAWNLRDPEAEAHPPPCPQCGNNPDGHAVEHDPDTGMPVMVCKDWGAEAVSPCPYNQGVEDAAEIADRYAEPPTLCGDWFNGAQVAAAQIATAIRALRMPDAPDPRDELIASLVEALKGLLAIADQPPIGRHFKLADTLDNSGSPYQSQQLADALEMARAALAKAEGT